MKQTLADALHPVSLTISASAAFLIQKYLFGDMEYLVWLCIVLTLDLVTGITRVALTEGIGAVTSKGIRMTLKKFIQYGSFLIVTHVLVHFTVGGRVVIGDAAAFLEGWAYTLLILVEIKSVYENIVAIEPRWAFVEKIISKINLIISEKEKEK